MFMLYIVLYFCNIFQIWYFVKIDLVVGQLDVFFFVYSLVDISLLLKGFIFVYSYLATANVKIY